MIESIEIHGYRGIAKGEVRGLRQLNVIIGPNNAGKSAVMQAIFMAFGQRYFAEWLGARMGLFTVPTRRDSLFAEETTIRLGILNGEARNDLTTTFKRQKDPRHLLIPGREMWDMTDLDASKRLADLPFWHQDSLSYLPADPEFFGQPGRFEDLISEIIVAGDRGKLIALLKPIMPAIEDIRVLSSRGRPVLYMQEDGDRVWPAAGLGDGMKRLMGLAAFLSIQGNLWCIEEPESHHHPSSARQVARLLWDSLRPLSPNQQIVVTTHSVPLLRQLLEQADGHEDQMRVLVLHRDRDVLTADSLSVHQARAHGHQNKIAQALDPSWPGRA